MSPGTDLPLGLRAQQSGPYDPHSALMGLGRLCCFEYPYLHNNDVSMCYYVSTTSLFTYSSVIQPGARAALSSNAISGNYLIISSAQVLDHTCAEEFQAPEQTLPNLSKLHTLWLYSGSCLAVCGSLLWKLKIVTFSFEMLQPGLKPEIRQGREGLRAQVEGTVKKVKL